MSPATTSLDTAVLVMVSAAWRMSVVCTLAELFAQYRDRLWRMVHLRLDRRLQDRLDPEDVLQEAYLILVKRIPEYVANPPMPFFLWSRQLTGQKLIDLHRQHLGAKMRDAGQEVSLYRGALPQASSQSLAAQLLGRLTSASRAATAVPAQARHAGKSGSGRRSGSTARSRSNRPERPRRFRRRNRSPAVPSG